MRSIKIAGLALASMLVMSMALAGNASAAKLLWLVCLKGSGLTKYNAGCLTANPSGEWQSLGVRAGTSITVRILALSIKLTDTGTALGTSSVTCGMTGSVGEGLIEEEGKGKITVAHYESPGTNCKAEGACKKAIKVEGVNLPWKTEIFETESKLLSTLKSGGSGAPGWAVECETSLGNLKDTCTGESEQGLLKNSVQTELLVAILFAERATASCTLGTSTSGTVKGLLAALLPGGALSIER